MIGIFCSLSYCVKEGMITTNDHHSKAMLSPLLYSLVVAKEGSSGVGLNVKTTPERSVVKEGDQHRGTYKKKITLIFATTTTT